MQTSDQLIFFIRTLSLPLLLFACVFCSFFAHTFALMNHVLRDNELENGTKTFKGIARKKKFVECQREFDICELLFMQIEP